MKCHWNCSGLWSNVWGLGRDRQCHSTLANSFLPKPHCCCAQGRIDQQHWEASVGAELHRSGCSSHLASDGRTRGAKGWAMNLILHHRAGEGAVVGTDPRQLWEEEVVETDPGQWWEEEVVGTFPGQC